MALAAGHHVFGFDVNVASQDRFLAKGGDRAEIVDAGAPSDAAVAKVYAKNAGLALPKAK